MKAPFSLTPRTQYHHGNLKEALVEAARALVSEHGPEGLTLAEAAKRVGVTGAAPYRHFSDRQALLRELGRRGFAQFGAALRAAFGDGTPNPQAAMRRMGTAYLNFAKSEPGLYRAMFSGPLASEDSLEARQAFEGLTHATSAVLQVNGEANLESAALALKIWSLSHGIAQLAQAGLLPLQGKESAESLLADATEDLFNAAIARGKG